MAGPSSSPGCNVWVCDFGSQLPLIRQPVVEPTTRLTALTELHVPQVTLVACEGALSFIHFPFPAYLFQQQTPFSHSVGGICRKERSNPSQHGSLSTAGPQPDHSPFLCPFQEEGNLQTQPICRKAAFHRKPERRYH